MWVAAQSHHESRGLTKAAKRAVQLAELQGLRTQWTARTLRVQGQSIIFAALFLAPGEGVAGANLITPTEVGVYLKAYSLPHRP